MNRWNEHISALSEACDIKKKNFEIIAEIGSIIKYEYGVEGLQKAYQELKDNYDVSLSYASMRDYVRMYDRAKEVNMPEDLPFHVKRRILARSDYKETIQKINNENMSAGDVVTYLQSLNKKERHTRVWEAMKKYCADIPLEAVEKILKA